ncbi:MAG: hypothetical protein JSW71_17050 [Gemmatimonadota bacterium]|nr:MAG: hypothetical protein JSW71_17050 [Gemmatimonadota bacterium]
MSEIETAIAAIEQAVSDYTSGSLDEDPLPKVEQQLRHIQQLAPKTPQIAALLSQIRHIAPVVFSLRQQERYWEIEKGKRVLLGDCARLREVTTA